MMIRMIIVKIGKRLKSIAVRVAWNAYVFRGETLCSKRRWGGIIPSPLMKKQLYCMTPISSKQKFKGRK
jgi:hypothetical protein